MITITNLNSSTPYRLFEKFYNEALARKQYSVEAIAISSYSQIKKEVDSRFVNLKFITDNEWIFFSNYESQKSIQFKENNQISALVYWNKINVQIRMKGMIKKTSKEFNQAYFSDRSEQKNALAISSDQSKVIESYDSVKKNYNKTLELDNLKECPNYWGGYSFTPYYFEFWEGHESRLNKREIFEINDNGWSHSILQP